MFNFYSSLVRDPCQKESYRRLKTFNQIICNDFAKWGKICITLLNCELLSGNISLCNMQLKNNDHLFEVTVMIRFIIHFGHISEIKAILRLLKEKKNEESLPLLN